MDVGGGPFVMRMRRKAVEERSREWESGSKYMLS